MDTTLLTELEGYQQLLAAPRGPVPSPNDWALLAIAERLTRRALKALEPTQAAMPAPVRNHYLQIRQQLRDTTANHSFWNERSAQVLEAGRLLKQLVA